MFAKVEDYSYKRLNSASFSFEIFFKNELLNQIVPFTIYFESKFHQNPTILRQVPTSFCCLPALSLVYTRPGASIGQYWRQTGTRLVPPWRQAGAMMAPGWHTTQTYQISSFGGSWVASLPNETVLRPSGRLSPNQLFQLI